MDGQRKCVEAVAGGGIVCFNGSIGLLNFSHGE
jgi:hypothetical protein